MSSSSWKAYLDPQIATRNRWTDRRYAGPAEVTEARTTRVRGARHRSITPAATVVLTVAAVVKFFVALA